MLNKIGTIQIRNSTKFVTGSGSGALKIRSWIRIPIRNKSFRILNTAFQELYGKIYMAATTDCASVVEATQVAEEVPGLTPAQVKAIRELHAKRTLLRKMEERSDARRLGGLTPLRQPAAVTAAKSLVGLAASPKMAAMSAAKPAVQSPVSHPKVG